MSIRQIVKLLPLVAFLAIGGSAFLSCSKQGQDEYTEKLTLTLQTSEASSSKGEGFVYITAPSSWTLSIKDNPDWASLTQSSGSGNNASVRLSWKANTDSLLRFCTLILEGNGETKDAVFQQSGIGGQSSEIKADKVGKWMELPATNNPKLYFITHPMTIDNKVYRNYSYYWDKDALVAHWVAYPLNATLLKGSYGRTPDWDLDPKIPAKYQPVLNLRGYGGTYDRGHQIPSADRQLEEYNKQTFYGVNQTPQNPSLNQGTWGALENYVRGKARSVDTLYVVTGCLVADSDTYATDNVGKKITVPTGYFKALLAYSKNRTIGITAKTAGYTGVAFYFDNAPYSGSYLNASRTIDDLESIIGIDLFVNLPGTIGENLANTVESTKDSWWSNN